MYETHRMLAKEREADFAREADTWERAAAVREARPDHADAHGESPRPFRARIAGLLARVARAEG